MSRINLSGKEFKDIVLLAIKSLPPRYIDNMENVTVVVQDHPSDKQRAKLKLVNNMTLYGLYEGVPIIRRSGNYGPIPPDKITIFEEPIIDSCNSLEEIAAHVKRTVWHEIGHHYGLSDEEIHKLEDHSNQ